MQHRYKQSKWIIGLSFFLSFFLCSIGMAAPGDSSGKVIEYLTQEKANLVNANHEIEQILPPVDQAALSARKKQNDAMLALTYVKMETFNSFLANEQKQKQKRLIHLKKIQQSSFTIADEKIALEKITQINSLASLNDKTIGLINDTLLLTQSYQKALILEKQKLELWQAKFNENQRIENLSKRIAVLNETRNNLYQKNIELQQEKKPDDFNVRFNYEGKLLLNNQIIILIQHRITELELHKKLIRADYLLIKNHSVKTIETITEIYEQAIEQLAATEQSLQKMAILLKRERILLADTSLKQQYINLQKTVDARLSEVAIQHQTLKHDLLNKQEELKKQLAVRQSLAEYHWDSWPLIFNEFVHIPTQFYNYLKVLTFKVSERYLWQDTTQIIYFWLSLGTTLLISLGLTLLLRKLTADKERSRLSAHLYDGLLVLLYRNLPQLTFTASVLVIFFLNHISMASYQLLLNLMVLWLIFRNLILLARMVLLDRMSDASGKDVGLYYHLKWLFLIGGWSAALMVISHQLPLSTLLQDSFNRLFMLFLVGVSIVAWKSKDIIPYFFEPKKRYIQKAITIVCVLIPLTLFTTSVIGLIGYFNLAWSLSGYQIYLLLLITSYVLIRGLIIDAMELLSEWMISVLRNGWLWVEVWLKPLDKILRLSLIVLSMCIVFELFGWHSDSWVTTTLLEIGKYPFVNLSGVHITLISTGEFAILLSAFLWASKWTREFSYRWLYRNSRDVGIRNSLSVFTQYAVILIGGFITLRVLGFDFSGLSMVLGGLAVGMGFGLRDFASNIIGGLTLLIERPVREGDLITIGEYEGRVAHIGIRSMRVSSWDNMEVLIPNAEAFNKPFTNWTHQDSVVRTVIPIKVSRSDDPVVVQHVILDILVTTPEILSDPPPQVFLKKIDEALIEFEARYFINVELHTRFEIRSKVLFAITEQFKAAGIKAPIPPLSIEFKESGGTHGANKQPIEERERVVEEV